MSVLGVIPNFFTAANLILGSSALVAVINHSPKTAAVLVLLAAFFDRADGSIARRCSCSSNFGKEFDSLADLVSFGVAPAALTYSAAVNKWHAPAPLGFLCFILFILCGAFRLARFNISGGGPYYQGLPITVAGSIMAAAAVVIKSPPAVLILCFVLAAAMVSTVRIPKI